MLGFRSAGSIGPEDVGRRVTVRHRLPDGGFSDTIGVLERLDPEVVAIRNRHGVLVEMSPGDIVAARVVPPPRPRG